MGTVPGALGRGRSMPASGWSASHSDGARAPSPARSEDRAPANKRDIAMCPVHHLAVLELPTRSRKRIEPWRP
jgi:hypothetical protein